MAIFNSVNGNYIKSCIGSNYVESDVENAFDNAYKLCCNECSISKERTFSGINDGTLVFKDGRWIIQEVKKDTTIQQAYKAFVQALMYAGSYLYDISFTHTKSDFRGVILTSSNFFGYIHPKDIPDFESLYNKYKHKTSPSSAYKIKELKEWAENNIKFTFVSEINESLRIDIILKSIYDETFS